MKLKRCSVEDVAIDYRLFDDGVDGCTVVCAGGLGGTHLVWTDLVRKLRSKHRIVIWNYPGLETSNGLSPDVPLDVPFLARCQAAVIDAEELRNPCLVGWSLGVQVALEMARSRASSVGALVAICGVAGHPFQSAQRDEPTSPLQESVDPLPVAMSWISDRMARIEALRAMLLRIEHPTQWAKRLGLVDPMTDDLIFDAVIRDFLAIDADTYKRYLRASAEHDADDVLPGISFPVLAMAGERDRFLAPRRVERMAAAIPGAEYFEVRGATHFLPVEYADLAALKIEEFLSRKGMQ